MEDSGIDSDPKQQALPEDDKLFTASDSSTSSSNSNGNTVTTPQKTSVKQLHRKLEFRIEQAKKIQRLQEYKKHNNNSSLIPIQRLPIPSKNVTTNQREQQPLVDWDTDESDEDTHFFPLSRNKETKKQELTDTFSIEDFEISPDEDDLNLLPPKPMYQRYCCAPPMEWNCVIM